MDDEEAYTLIDLYAQECEQAPTVEAVKLLQYNMLLDFTQRVAREKLPPHLSPEITQCVQFLRGHLFGTVGIDEAAGWVGKSRAWLTRKFKEEMGQSFWGVSILPANPGGQTPDAVHGHQSQRNRGDAWIFQPSVLPLIFQESSGHDALRVSETVKRRKGEGRVGHAALRQSKNE